MRLISNGVGCSILGREVGKSLITLTKKLANDDLVPIAEVARRLAEWKEREISLANANGKEERVAIITDKSECLTAVMSNSTCRNAGGLRDILYRLFSDDNVRIVLSTGHKAKGLEWDSVIHLDPWRIPSKFAREALENGNPVPYQQDMNLRYVIETRSKNALIMARFDDMEKND
jgi:superfamily I DNA/RNA helicase